MVGDSHAPYRLQVDIDPSTPAADTPATFRDSHFSGDAGGETVQEWWVWVGTSVDGTQIYTQNQGTATGRTVNNLPTNGSKVYVRLHYKQNGAYTQWNDYTYTAAGGVVPLGFYTDFDYFDDWRSNDLWYTEGGALQTNTDCGVPYYYTAWYGAFTDLTTLYADFVYEARLKMYAPYVAAANGGGANVTWCQSSMPITVQTHSSALLHPACKYLAGSLKCHPASN